MKMVADANIPELTRTFGRHGELRTVDGRSLGRHELEDAEVLLVRSVTQVNGALLEGSSVRFVGSTTIGIDHLDTQWLDRRGIAWTSAPGCNADAAAQYTLAMMLEACRRLGRDFRKQQVGIIGRGNVGSRLHRLLKALGVPTLACDPPLAEAGMQGLVDLRAALVQPVVSLHVPLSRTGPWPTAHMIGDDELRRMSRGALLVNTARGEVVDGDALLGALDDGLVHAALDVWPSEPEIDPGLLEAATVATPHVAGYSLEGRRNGTLMVYRAFCDWAALPYEPPAFDDPQPTVDVRAADDPVAHAVGHACRVGFDDRALRGAQGPRQRRTAAFDALRRDYRLRRDFGSWRVLARPEDRALLTALGFRTEPIAEWPQSV